jgi:hypothetical protein
VKKQILLVMDSIKPASTRGVPGKVFYTVEQEIEALSITLISLTGYF